MLGLDKIKKILNNKKIKTYEVNISLENINNGIQFPSLESFEQFVFEQNIEVIFISKYYDNAENYIITEETFRKARRYFEPYIIDILSKDIDKYNKEVLKTNFDEMCAIIIACIYQGQYCFVYMEDDNNSNKRNLIPPIEKLEEIIQKNISLIEEKEKENNNCIENLKIKLHEKIIKDEKFLLCTNKQLRKNYIRNLLKNDLGKEYSPLKDLWTTDAMVGVYTDAIDFIELIWNEVKINNK